MHAVSARLSQHYSTVDLTVLLAGTICVSYSVNSERWLAWTPYPDAVSSQQETGVTMPAQCWGNTNWRCPNIGPAMGRDLLIVPGYSDASMSVSRTSWTITDHSAVKDHWFVSQIAVLSAKPIPGGAISSQVLRVFPKLPLFFITFLFFFVNDSIILDETFKGVLYF